MMIHDELFVILSVWHVCLFLSNDTHTLTKLMCACVCTCVRVCVCVCGGGGMESDSVL